MKTNDERFDEWWAQHGAKAEATLLLRGRDLARAAVKALCLSDEDRERIVPALILAESRHRKATRRLAANAPDDAETCSREANRLAAVRLRLEGTNDAS